MTHDPSPAVAPEAAFDVFPDAPPASRLLTTAALLALAPRLAPGAPLRFQGPPASAPRLAGKARR